jgi:hypothetical protein
MSRPPHSLWFDLRNDIWGWVQNMKILTVLPTCWKKRRFISVCTRARHLSHFKSGGFISYFLKPHFNSILPSTPSPPMCSLLIKFPNQNSV